MVVLLITCSYSMFQIFLVFLLVWQVHRTRVLANHGGCLTAGLLVNAASVAVFAVTQNGPLAAVLVQLVVPGAQFYWFRVSIIGLTPNNQ